MIATHDNPTTELKKAIFDLVKGEFTQEEAFEIVNDLFAKKINFHESKSFSQLVRNGQSDPAEHDRISELQNSREQSSQLIAEAKKSGKSLRVSSTITIELI